MSAVRSSPGGRGLPGSTGVQSGRVSALSSVDTLASHVEDTIPNRAEHDIWRDRPLGSCRFTILTGCNCPRGRSEACVTLRTPPPGTPCPVCSLGDLDVQAGRLLCSECPLTIEVMGEGFTLEEVAMRRRRYRNKYGAESGNDSRVEEATSNSRPQDLIGRKQESCRFIT